MEKELITILMILMITNLVEAGAMGETVVDIKTLFYGITAGFGALLIALHGIKWKTATNPEERKEAERGIIHVILGLLIIGIAAGIVEMIYWKPLTLSHPWIIAHNWQNTGPDEQMGLELNITNTLNYSLTGVEVRVTVVEYDSCFQDNLFHPKNLPDIGINDTGVYRHWNFCANATKFDVDIISNQNSWEYCVECLECPPASWGNCNPRFGPC